MTPTHDPIDKGPTNTLSKAGSVQVGSWTRYLEQASGQPLKSRLRGATVFLLIDCSESKGRGNKLCFATKGAIGYAHSAIEQGYDVGAISFASQAELVAEAGLEVEALPPRLERLVASGSTNMAQAISMGTQYLENRRGLKAMCLITDGYPNESEDTLEAARRARGLGIQICAIGTDDADRDFLAALTTSDRLALCAAPQLESAITRMALMLPAPKND